MAIVDVGGHRVRQLISSNSSVTEVAFGHEVGFVMSADQAMIRAVDFSRDRCGPFPVRRLTFGAPAKTAVVHDGLIAPIGGGHSVVAVHRESYTGFILHPVSAKTDMPPMSPVRLRGGIPREIAPMPRGSRAEGGGRFSTWARVESAAEYELVLVNGLDFSARCVRLPAPDADLSRRREPGRLMMVTRDGVGTLRLVDSAGEPVRSTEVRLLVAGLRTRHRDGLVLRTDPNGDLHPSDVPERPRPYAISARTATGQTFRIFVVRQR